MNITDAGVVDVAERVRTGRTSAVEVLSAYLDRIERLDGSLGSFLSVDRDGAMSDAQDLDARVRDGQDPGPLCGVPLAVKDNLCTKDIVTTCGSRMLEGYRPPYDAHVVGRLRDCGAVLLGKTNMDEFSMGSSNENSAYYPVKNPWNHAFVPGGSSGGSAAAVAARLCTAALGSDTGGSVRQPGAFCGVTALKPTYGRVSRRGLVAFASSLDQVGVMGRSARDIGRVLDAISGWDPRDATSARRPVDSCEQGAQQTEVAGLRVGVLKQAIDSLEHSGVADATHEVIASLRGLGCSVQDVELPHAGLSVSSYYLIATAEASSNLARFDGVRFGRRVPARDLEGLYTASRTEGLGDEVKRRILLGTYVLSAGYYEAYYLKAAKVRTKIVHDFATAFADVDVVVGPTSPTPAFRLGERVRDPLSMYLADVFTLPPSLAGLPSMNVPAGLTRDGLPVGVQVTAPAFCEPRLLSVGAALERACDFVDARPPTNQLDSLY